MSNSDAPVLHLAHPRSVPWSTLMEPAAKIFGLPMVPYEKWLQLLEQSGQDLSSDKEVEVMRQNPALKILNFFLEVTKASASPEAMGVPQMSVVEAQQAAPSLRQLSPLSVGDVMRWVSYWKKIGFLRT